MCALFSLRMLANEHGIQQKIWLLIAAHMRGGRLYVVKFIYSEKATKFCEISTLLLSYVVPVKSKVKISQNFVAFSEYVNFTKLYPNFYMEWMKNRSNIFEAVEIRIPIWSLFLDQFCSLISMPLRCYLSMGYQTYVFDVKEQSIRNLERKDYACKICCQLFVNNLLWKFNE